ncbi:MAG: phosphatidate cytidylyltransferase [Cypionkella sp.]|nr:phosphatidate cytidylyltransferase [Cypionkella sp.]
MILLNNNHGRVGEIWLIGVVILSDIAGYFAGRILGGPKFWPAISPKKTWSGTVAGWMGAAGLGAAFWAAGYGGAALIILSPLVAFAGQMGDIGESWLKRRAGIKDSSNLIPGHGGFLDRFDALIGAALVVLALQMAAPEVLAFGG